MTANARAKRYAKAQAEGVARDYYAALAAMPSHGGRHAYIAQFVRPKAMRAKSILALDEERFIDDCQNAGGEPQLTRAELRSIWRWTSAQTDWQIAPVIPGEGVTPPQAPRRAKPQPQPWERQPTEQERLFVADTIAHGKAFVEAARAEFATPTLKASDLLRKCSQIELGKEPGEQAAAHVGALAAYARSIVGAGVRCKWFAGERQQARDASKVQPADELATDWLHGAPVPSLVSVNPLTGEGVNKSSEGGLNGLSFRCAECVAAWVFALIEFDEMPLDEQAAFWLGVITDGTLDVVSVTHSAGKSIHGIIAVPQTPAGSVGTADNYRAAWGKVNHGTGDVVTWGVLLRLLYSSTDKRQRVDAAAANVLTTRLGGHLRTDWNQQHYKPNRPPTRQRLLWLAAARKADAEPQPEPVTAQPQTVEANFAQRCDACPSLSQCRAAFGTFWLDRSSGGKGCQHPFTANRQQPKPPPEKKPSGAAAVALDAIRDEIGERWEYVRTFIRHTGVVPLWLQNRIKAKGESNGS